MASETVRGVCLWCCCDGTSGVWTELKMTAGKASMIDHILKTCDVTALRLPLTVAISVQLNLPEL